MKVRLVEVEISHEGRDRRVNGDGFRKHRIGERSFKVGWWFVRVVWSARESVGFVKDAWFMLNCDSVLHNSGDSSFRAWCQLLGFSVVGQVCVIGVDNGWLS